jgi:hypothetical protein
MPEDRRDIRVERVLERLQIPWTFEPDFPLADVVKAESGTQVRTDAAHRATVDEYAVAYQNGAQFPPLVLHHQTKKLIDGNTRYAGATKAHVESHPVYLVEAKTPRLASIVQGALNQLNGERLSNEQATETARLMHEQGYSAEEIAYSTGRRFATIQDTIRVIDLEKRADHLGLPVDKLSKNVKIQLAGIQLDEPLRLVTAAVAAKAIGGDEVREISNRLAATHSEADAIGVVKDQLATWDKEAVPPRNHVPKEKGGPVRRAAEALMERIRLLQWEQLADADYRVTINTLQALSTAIADLPKR